MGSPRFSLSKDRRMVLHWKVIVKRVARARRSTPVGPILHLAKQNASLHPRVGNRREEFSTRSGQRESTSIERRKK